MDQWRHVKFVENAADIGTRVMSIEGFKESLWLNGPAWLQPGEDNWPKPWCQENEREPEQSLLLRTNRIEVPTTYLEEMVLPLHLSNNKSSTHRSCTVIGLRVMSSCSDKIHLTPWLSKHHHQRQQHELQKTLNARPLTAVSDNPEDLTVLTPNHFLLGRESASAPFMSSSERYHDLRKSFKTAQAYADIIWKRWTREYLPQWNQRSKWSKEHVRNLKERKILWMVDDSVKRCEYKMGRFIKVFKNHDGVVQSARVKLAHGEFNRLVVKLAPVFYDAAVTRFISRRGYPSTIISDNSTNFVGAAKELKAFMDEWDKTKTESDLAEKKFVWKFHPLGGPHFGGIWERLVQKKTLNARPLTAVSDNPEDLTVLTPNHFLLGRESASAPFMSSSERYHDLRKSFKTAQAYADIIWKRWTREYLPQWNQRSKWSKEHVRNLKERKILWMVDDSVKRCEYKMGRFIKVFKNHDGVVQSARVKLAHGEFNRLTQVDLQNQCSQLEKLKSTNSHFEENSSSFNKHWIIFVTRPETQQKKYWENEAPSVRRYETS
ncbi:uncharacterized protein LOC142336705 [Convolutriloba macropyga]|uniref:uncharacterized protein LOC142336705 n=1 Tax=Convolutriloba macropyga TaxID=536237 RepID=UPI003F51F6C9